MSGRIDFFSLTRTIQGRHPAEDLQWPASPVADGELSREALRYLVELHEYDHLAALLASPLGLLLWRIQLTHVIDGLWFADRLQEADASPVIGGVDRWFSVSANRQRFIAIAAAGRLSPHKPPATPQDAIRTADRYLEGLAAARSLQDYLFGRFASPKARVGDILRAANVGLRYVAVRSDLRPAFWVSRRDLSSPLYEPNGVNARHILEAMAREYEFDVIKERVPAEVAARWQSRMLTGVYRPVVELLRDAGLQGIAARNLCAAALGGRLDPATRAVATGPLIIDDELPWFRLDRLLRTLKRGVLAPDDLRSRAGIELLCVAAGLPSLREAARAAAGRPLLGDGANWDPLNRSGLAFDGDPAGALFKWVEDARMDLPRWFERSFLAQAAAWETGQLVTPDLPLAPVLYDDAATIRPQSTADDGIAREVARWCARLLAEYAIAFIQGRPVMSRSTMARRVSAGLTLAGLEANTARDSAHRLFLGGSGPTDESSLVGLLVPDIIQKSLTFIRDDQPAD